MVKTSLYNRLKMRSPKIFMALVVVFVVGCVKYNVQGTIPQVFIQVDAVNNRVLIWNGGIPSNNLQAASVVLGQPDFYSNTANNSPTSAGGAGTTSAYSLNNPGFASFDGQRLFIIDQNNSRVLVWNRLPTQNQQPADLVLGQTSFSGNQQNQGNVNPDATTLKIPEGIFSDGTHLFVADGNRRVLIWNTIPTSTAQPADVVIGQTQMTTAAVGPTRVLFTAPITVFFDGNNLFVGDIGSGNRVLVWNSLPINNGQPADLVLGQVDFTHGLANQGFANPTSQTLNSPHDIETYEGHLVIADSSNNRILVWNSIPTLNDQAADIVIGQPNMSSNNSGATAQSFNYPTGIYLDSFQLLVSDSHNNRALAFNGFPFVANPSANYAIGQPDLFSSNINAGGALGPVGFSSPIGMTSNSKISGVQRSGGY